MNKELYGFKIGDRVSHDEFGDGVIYEFDDDDALLVMFDKSSSALHNCAVGIGYQQFWWYGFNASPIDELTHIIEPPKKEEINCSTCAFGNYSGLGACGATEPCTGDYNRWKSKEEMYRAGKYKQGEEVTIMCEDTPEEADPDGLDAHAPGAKLDAGKIRYTLIPWQPLKWLAELYTRGAIKYSDGGWKEVENGEARYSDALMRHFEKYRAGVWMDEETGCPHLIAVAWCAFAMVWFRENK